MTLLTVQDLDNFELLVSHCETNEGHYLKLSRQNNNWWISLIRLPMSPLRFEGATFEIAVQLAADAIRRDYHDRKVTAALTQSIKGPTGMTGTENLIAKAQRPLQHGDSLTDRWNEVMAEKIPTGPISWSGDAMPELTDEQIAKASWPMTPERLRKIKDELGIDDHIDLSDN